MQYNLLKRNVGRVNAKKKLKILVVSSEVVPFAKTGGLADVSGALPVALEKLVYEVGVAMPKYGVINEAKAKLSGQIMTFDITLGNNTKNAIIKKGKLPDSNVNVYFIQNDYYFNRRELYSEAGQDYEDNAQRFAFFSMAVLVMLKNLNWQPDIIHCNDWQTAMIPTYLKTLFREDDFFRNTKVLYTIHNLAYQGSFSKNLIFDIGLNWNYFNPNSVEFYDKINFMKAGLIYADKISTVSEGYSKEIQTPEYGCGLEGVLQFRKNDLTGIMNGIDYSVWNPEIDDYMAKKFSVDDTSGKSACKKDLQKICGLPENANVPLIGIISRLADQKGFDLIAEVIDKIMKMDLQIVILGTGEPKYHTLFEEMGKKFKDKISVNLKFDNALAHKIEAGSDMFLMPSQYEPCGLNQLYSLKYGTVPIVRHTGGLADSVIDFTPELNKKGEATGFKFYEYKSGELLETIKKAVKVYNAKPMWFKLRKNGMLKDFSWTVSAKKYEQLFLKMIG